LQSLYPIFRNKQTFQATLKRNNVILHVKMPRMNIKRYINSPITSNCYLITDNGHAIVLDPGTDGSKMLIRDISDDGLILDFIILTHEHFDHCVGTNSLRKALKAPLLCSSICNELIQDSRGNYSAYWMEGDPFIIKAADRIISDKETLLWEDHKLNFFSASGHSNGSMAIVIDDTALFTGDDFVPGIRTYTNLNGGSKEKLRTTLARFDEYKQNKEMIVYPGHLDSIPISIVHFNEALRGYSYQQMLQEKKNLR
jgi:hydroxyacylglutathione hydrolase